MHPACNTHCRSAFNRQSSPSRFLSARVTSIKVLPHTHASMSTYSITSGYNLLKISEKLSPIYVKASEDYYLDTDYPCRHSKNGIKMFHVPSTETREPRFKEPDPYIMSVSPDSLLAFLQVFSEEVVYLSKLVEQKHSFLSHTSSIHALAQLTH